MSSSDFDNSIPNIEYFIYRNNTPEWRIEESETDFVDITYVIGGNANYIIDSQEITVSAGDLLCIPKKSYRSASSTTASRFECFAANLRIHDLDGGELPIPLPLLSSVGIHTDIIAQYKRLNENWLKRGPGYKMRVRAHFMLILQRFLEMLLYEVDTYQFDSRVKSAIRYMTDNYAESVNINHVAEILQLTPNYLGVLFKKETKITFRDYLNMIRLNQAEDMLRAGKGNITEVAQKCGFKDVFYFSRLFKKHKGATPSSVKA